MLSLTRFMLCLIPMLFFTHLNSVWGVIWLIQALIFFALGIIVGLVAFKVSVPVALCFPTQLIRLLAIGCRAKNTVITFPTRSWLVFWFTIDIPRHSHGDAYDCRIRSIGTSVNIYFLTLCYLAAYRMLCRVIVSQT
jgi:hypothetical protein